MEAKCNAVSPVRVVKLGSAPRLSNILTASPRPLLAAKCKGVDPKVLNAHVYIHTYSSKSLNYIQ